MELYDFWDLHKNKLGTVEAGTGGYEWKMLEDANGNMRFIVLSPLVLQMCKIFYNNIISKMYCNTSSVTKHKTMRNSVNPFCFFIGNIIDEI